MKNGEIATVFTRIACMNRLHTFRLFLCIILLTCLQLSARAFADQKITLNLQSVELKKVLLAIEKKSDYRFMYNESVIANKPKIDLDVKDAGITEILRIVLLNNGIAYSILNNNLIVLRSNQEAEAKVIHVSGRVTGPGGAPLQGVSVTIRSSTTGTVTNENGEYSINVPDENSVLVFSSVGYNSQSVVAGNRTTINISLEASASQMDNIVVIGYGTSRKKDLTGSSSSVKGAEIINIPALTATQALQSKVAGVQITNNGGPGTAPDIRIRGTGSILGGVQPLYVVDGIITTDIRNINNADILSIDILKDASSTAIYGARAANGVVLITTKAGSKNKFTISYNGQTGVKILTHKVEMSPPNLFTLYSNEAAGVNTILTADITGSTDWYDELTRPAIFTNHNLSVGGGKNKYKYYASAGYLYEQGLLLDNDYRRIVLRYNHDYTFSPKLKIGNTLSASDYLSNNKPFSLFTSAYTAAPIYNAVNPDGSYGWTTKSDVGNPLATLKYTNDQSWGNRLQGTLWGEYQIIKGLTFRSSFGIDGELNNGQIYNPVYKVGNSLQKNETSQLTYKRDSIYQWVWDNIVTWEKKFQKGHNLKLTGGHTAERRNGWKNSAIRKNVANDKDQWELDFTDTTGKQDNLREPIEIYFRRESWLLRANYRYKERYLLNATFRRDANSNFSEENRWGNFPSVGLGWIISDEPFMNKQEIFNALKLRASYGLVGNDVIKPGMFDLRPQDRLFAYFGNTQINGAIVPGIVDPHLKWEVVKEFDFGVEFTVLNNKLSGEIDYYHKKATDALYTIPLVNVGMGPDFLTNAADISNKGVEISLGWNETVNKNTRYSLRGNITFNKNNVENVGLGKALNYGSLNNGWTATQTLVGQPIGSFWVFKTDGIFQNQSEVNAVPHVTTAAPGDFRIVDVNKDGIIDNQDRQNVGSYQPKLYYGFNGTLNIKRFDFSLDIFGNSGNKVYNGKKGIRYGGNYNVEYDVAIYRWIQGSNNNKYPRAYNGVPYPTDYFVESGSFVRINNITAGYTIGAKWAAKVFSSARVFASAQNPWLYTDYTGFTPELPGNQNEAGIELNVYPISATYSIGLNLQFK
jgi:TonB-linked SusC/RagA family outer membrane protein